MSQIVSSLAGKLAPKSILVDVAKLSRAASAERRT
jgi:hypothetical protein